MASFDSDDSSGDDSGAEGYEMAGQGLNDFEKSEIRFVPLRFRRRGAIKKDYKALRLYLLKKDVDVGKLDGEVQTKYAKWIKKHPPKAGGKLEDDDELLFSHASTANGKMRKAQAL